MPGKVRGRYEHDTGRISRPDATDAVKRAIVKRIIAKLEKEFPNMNFNAIHNLLNLIGLVIGALLAYDFTQIGLSAEGAAMLASWLLLGDKIIKLALNIIRDGIGGLFKVQPPVQK